MNQNSDNVFSSKIDEKSILLASVFSMRARNTLSFANSLCNSTVSSII